MLVNLSAIASLVSDDELLKVSRDNPDFRFERNRFGKLIIMSPTGSSTGEKNSSLLIQVGNWNLSTKKGKVFDSSTGFKFSDGAVRSPDVSWIELSRWRELTQEQQDKFAPIDPDFVIELKSPTDKLFELQQKMSEYRSCGVRLGWLINPTQKQVEIYRHGQNKEVLDHPSNLSGEDVLPGLKVDLTDIF
jgi:Uma2 family endonuclease